MARLAGGGGIAPATGGGGGGGIPSDGGGGPGTGIAELDPIVGIAPRHELISYSTWSFFNYYTFK